MSDDEAHHLLWLVYKARLTGLRETAKSESIDRLIEYLDIWFTQNGHGTLFSTVNETDFKKAASATFWFASQIAGEKMRERMLEKHPDVIATRVMAFHVLVGGTIKPHQAPELDYPGAFSIKGLFDRGIKGKEPDLLPEALLTAPSGIMQHALKPYPVFRELYALLEARILTTTQPKTALGTLDT